MESGYRISVQIGGVTLAASGQSDGLCPGPQGCGILLLGGARGRLDALWQSSMQLLLLMKLPLPLPSRWRAHHDKILQTVTRALELC